MILRTALCLAVTAAAAGTKPPAKRPAKTAAPQAKGDAAVPAAGSIGERVEPATGRGRAIGAFLEPRTDYQATAFPDGRVLVTGGSLKTASSEWFDPATNTFAPGPAMMRPRQGHRALLLKDGRLLVLGGTEAPATAEVLEPGTKAFKEVPETSFGLSTDAVELDKGRVCMIDGASGTVCVWDGRRAPSAKTTLTRPRIFFRAVRMKDGRVAVTGGWPSEQKTREVRGRRASSGPALPVECFNPTWSSISAWTAAPQPRARHQAALLEDGRIVLWGGVGQDPDQSVKDLEVLDPGKETVTKTGTLDLQGGPAPAWAVDGTGRFLHLAERSRSIQVCADPLALPAAAPGNRLANGYLGPVLVPLKDGGVLVLGTASFGDPLDRWDARTRQCAVVGTLRGGAESLGLLPDGKVVAIGPVVDLLDPRTGAMTPLGWREDLEPLLKTLRPAVPAPAAQPLPGGQERPGALVVTLDKTRLLVVGGISGGEPSGAVEIWDTKKKTLQPAGSTRTRRARPGGLKLVDGSVLIWGAGKE